jgi:Tfp pilus assembly protein PilX
MNRQRHGAKCNRGVALILVLIMILVLSVLVAGIVFVAQTQTWTGYNYKTTTQARYASEAGIQHTINWLMNGYTPPSSFAAYNTTTYPVQATANSQTVLLSGSSSVAANYPDSTQQTAYNSALSNQSVPGMLGATFSTYATLLRMTPGNGASWLSGTSGVPQVWQITSVGNIAGLRPASIQLQATYERTSTPIFNYGIAADGTSCQDVDFTNGTMNAWNSSKGTYATTVQTTGAAIGTNGNVMLNGGSTEVDGTISDSSNINVGNCPDGITNNSGSGAYQSLQSLGTPLSYPAPTAPNPMTPNTNLNVNSNTCWGASPAGCTVVGSGATAQVDIAPGSYGNITSNSNVVLSAGTYNINSLNLNGGSITLSSVPVVINLGGDGINSGQALFASPNTTINDGGIPANLQIVSAAGTPNAANSGNVPVITMNGSSAMYAVVYAPNAYVHITGSSQFLGAVVGQFVTSDSSGGFSYDLALQTSLLQVGNFVPVNYTWNKF